MLRDPAASALRDALRSGLLPVLSIDLENPDEAAALLRYDALPAFRGRGDAEVLALGSSRDLLVGSDDRAVRAQARREFGAARLAGTADFLVWAVREQRITAGEAEALLERLDVGPAIEAWLRRTGKRLGDLV